MKILSGFYSLLEFADIFQFPLTFILNRREKTSTKAGKIITIGILIFFFSTFMTSDAVNKTNPKSLTQDVSQSSRPALYLSKENLTLAVGVWNYNKTILSDEAVFGFFFRIFHKNSTRGTYEIATYKMKLCSNTDFLENQIDFSNMGLNGSYCLPNEPFRLSGYWDESTLDYVDITLKICKNSSDSFETCRNSDEINEYLKNTYIYVYISNHNLDASNRYSPMPHSLKMYSHQIEVKFTKKANLFLKKTDIETDDGFMFESIDVTSSFIQSEIFLDISNFDEEQSVLYCLSLYSSDLKMKVRREYQKVQVLLAQLGGIFHFLLILGFLICKIENTYRLTSTLSNELFLFPSSPPLKSSSKSSTQKDFTIQEKTKLPPASEKEISNFRSVSFLTKLTKPHYFPLGSSKFSANFKRIASVLNIQNSNLTNRNQRCPMVFDSQKNPLDKNVSNLPFGKNTPVMAEKSLHSAVKIDVQSGEKHSPWRERIHSLFKNSGENTPRLKKMATTERFRVSNIENYQKIKQKENFFSIGFFGYLKLMVKNRRWWLTMKEQLFLKAEDQISEELDILKILQKLHDIDKLKRILLDENQLYFFNLLSKPMIVLDQRKSNMEYSDRRFKFSAKKKTILNTETTAKLYSGLLKHSESSEVNKRILKLLDEDVKCILENENFDK